MRLTLEDLEAERGEFEPFELDLGDDVIVSLPHPEDLPFDTLISFDTASPVRVLRMVMGDDAFDHLATLERGDGTKRVTLGVARVILERYQAHYGLGSPGEGGASRPSSIGSARRSKQTSRRKATA